MKYIWMLSWSTFLRQFSEWLSITTRSSNKFLFYWLNFTLTSPSELLLTFTLLEYVIETLSLKIYLLTQQIILWKFAISDLLNAWSREKSTFHTFAQDITELLSLFSEQQSITTLLMSGQLAALSQNFYLDSPSSLASQELINS
jgi:hypothetical protein